MAKSASVDIDLSADGKPISALSKLIADRIKYTTESAKQALAACAIQILISLRAVTAVAKVDRVKVEEEAGLYASIHQQGGAKIPCLRVVGSNTRLPIRNVLWPPRGAKMRTLHVFSFVENRGEKSRKRYIVATNAKAAQIAASDFIKRRIARHKGLAKLALGKLMNKAAQTSKPLTDKVTEDTTRIADSVTRALATATGSGNSGSYSLTLEDNLDYAMLALKGGKQAIDTAVMKAANRIASVIQRKVADNFFAPRIETPFPEIRSTKP